MKKNKKTKAKKTAKKSSPKKDESMALAVVSYKDIAGAEMFTSKNEKGRELHLMQSHFPKKVIDFINMPTPRKFILKRPGTGGMKFDYIPGWYAKKCANYVFGFSNYSFEIKKKEIVGLSAIVEGRLSVSDPKTGRELFHKDDIGGHAIRFLKNKAHTPENAVDLANDYKAATTDCMKRCMVQIGFWKDVYGMNEAKDEGTIIREEASVISEEDTVPGMDGEPVLICKGCDAIVDEQVANYSKKMFGKILCRECQANAKPKK